MLRNKHSSLESLILATLILLLPGCGNLSLESMATPNFTQKPSDEPLQAPSMPLPSNLPTSTLASNRMVTVQPTSTLLVTLTSTVAPLPGKEDCSPIEIKAYLKTVLPLTDEHTLDAFEAQKMGQLNEESKILNYKDRAILRLKAAEEINSPSCLVEAHKKILFSFTLLNSTLDLILLKDYSTATSLLQDCYEVMAEAIAIITDVKEPSGESPAGQGEVPAVPASQEQVELDLKAQEAKVIWDTSHGPREGQDGIYSVAGIYGNLADLLLRITLPWKITIMPSARAS